MIKKVGLIVLSILVILTITTVSASDITGGKSITVDESKFNTSSNTIYTVMLPPGFVNLTKDDPIGPITTFTNETDANSVITIVVIDNPTKQQFNDKNSKDFLNNFMIGGNATPISGSEPTYLQNGGIINYGTNGDETVGVYVLSTDEKVIIVTGLYKNLDDALAGSENLGTIAGSIQITGPSGEPEE
jgi:hypothetical protein